MDQLNQMVSYQSNVSAPLGMELTIHQTLSIIQSEELRDRIQSLRVLIQEGRIEDSKILKKALPAVTFSATFTGKRVAANLKTYNSIVVLDIDSLAEEQLESIRSEFYHDKYVFAYWISPSGKGIKGLVAVAMEKELETMDVNTRHKTAFRNLSDYFSTNYGVVLDQSGSDTTRLCFLSSDPNLIYKSNVEIFPVAKRDNSNEENKMKVQNESTPIDLGSNRNALYNPIGRNSSSSRSVITSIIKYLRKSNSSITSNYNDWLRVGFAIADSFTYDIGKKYFLELCRLDKERHNEVKSTNLLITCYFKTKKRISFNTIVYLARQKGYKKLGGSEGGSS